jgi:hypothetical protein
MVKYGKADLARDIEERSMTRQPIREQAEGRVDWWIALVSMLADFIVA